MYIIYKLTNKINNKLYIGCSKYSAEKRFNRHVVEATRNTTKSILHKAIRKYGRESFSIETLETLLTEQDMFEREKYYILFYNSNIHGYNLTIGGDAGPVNIGSKNGMYGKKHTLSAKLKMSEKKKLLTGDKHPHYNKPSPLKGRTYNQMHGDKIALEIKTKQRIAQLGKSRPYNVGDNNPAKRIDVREKISIARSKPITVNNITYKNKKQAALELNISLYKLNKLILTY